MWERRKINEFHAFSEKSVLCIGVQSSVVWLLLHRSRPSMYNCISVEHYIPNSLNLELVFFYDFSKHFFPFGQIAYYVLRRDKPEEWKCQPYQWLPRDLEIHEMVVGWFSLSIGSLISSALACWVMNGGWSTLYFDPAEHGYVWLVLQIPLIFIWQVGSLWIFGPSTLQKPSKNGYNSITYLTQLELANRLAHARLIRLHF